MLDSNLLFHNAAALTTTSTSSALDIKKTSSEGVVIEIAVTALAGSTTGRTLDWVVKESDDDSTYNTNTTFPQVTATGRYTRRIQSKKRYLKLALTAGAATGLSATVTAGIASGNVRNGAA